MSTTVPLNTPVRSITSARAVAESAADAGPDDAIGAAVDRIMIFLNRLSYDELAAVTEGVYDVLALLGTQRARRGTDWLTAHARDLDSACFWAELNELTYLGCDA